jgi:hypothetical protein
MKWVNNSNIFIADHPQKSGLSIDHRADKLIEIDFSIIIFVEVVHNFVDFVGVEGRREVVF